MLLLGVLLTIIAGGCKKQEPVNETETEEATFVDAYFLFRFREPLDGQVCYHLLSFFISRASSAEQIDRSSIVGMDRLVERIDKMQKPCELFARDFSKVLYPTEGIKDIIDDPNDIMCELTDSEIDQLKDMLKSKNIQQVKIY